jgi:hypothetical protein
VVPSTVSSITSNFNGTAIPAGDTIWFSSVAQVQGVGSSPVTIQVVNQTISFTANGVNETVSVPNTQLTLSPSATTATTTFNAGTDSWQTSTPTKFSGNVFLDGVSFQPAGGLPGGIKNVKWQGSFSSDTAGISVNWQWAAAVYTQFSSDNTTLNVKSVDDNHLGTPANSDHAGTPEAYKPYVVGGATGGGGSNWTGSYSGTASVVPAVQAPPQGASLSGTVTGQGGTPLVGIVVVLTGTDNLGNPVTQDATTDSLGNFLFTGIAPGTYTLEEPPGEGLNQTDVGTDNGATDGTPSSGDIIDIVLNNGDDATNYDFKTLSE